MKIIPYIVMFGLTACTAKTQEKNIIMSPTDVHSYARPQDAVIKHISLDLEVDFKSKQLRGSAELEILNISGTDSLHLDTRDLQIESVTLDDGSSADYILKPAVKHLGSELIIPIRSETGKVKIKYQTSPTAAALQWLSPGQTAGGKHPFLFTQSQAILARTWIPLQDSPGIRFTYDATIKCPAGLMAVMSAENDTAVHPDGIYHFKMPQAIPSYLMALSVGDLHFHSYDARSGVFAEPVTLEKAAFEFSDLPLMISAAEELYGPYAWGRYDVLVLPPSFPFGGMENPRVTFATPTIIAGDKSLVSLIAHELAHSWSGNLVTNATWNDFWLNEGFTVYFESRIMEKIYGKPYADMLTVLGMGELKATVEDMGKTNPDTKLYLNLEGRDPDDGVSDIAYEKGRFLLYTIEQAIGREKWDQFLNEYFKAHAFQSITTEKFLAYYDSVLVKGNKDIEEKVKIKDWIFQPGLPDVFPKIESAELNRAGNAAAKFIKDKNAAGIDTSGWTTHHYLYFLRSLPMPMNNELMKQLDEKFQFTKSGNSEILCNWLLHAVKSKYETAYPALENFLMEVGRRKFLKPLYAALASTPEGKQRAKEIYKKARPGYHAVSSETIDEMLN